MMTLRMAKNFLAGSGLVRKSAIFLSDSTKGTTILWSSTSLSDPEHFSVAMFHAAVVRVIVRGVNSAHVVEMKARWRRVILKGEFGVQAPQVDRFLGRLGCGHELGLAGRECDYGLSF